MKPVNLIAAKKEPELREVNLRGTEQPIDTAADLRRMPATKEDVPASSD
jgi:hypothetical protein